MGRENFVVSLLPKSPWAQIPPRPPLLRDCVAIETSGQRRSSQADFESVRMRSLNGTGNYLYCWECSFFNGLERLSLFA
jgi:hypothetical protein